MLPSDSSYLRLLFLESIRDAVARQHENLSSDQIAEEVISNLLNARGLQFPPEFLPRWRSGVASVLEKRRNFIPVVAQEESIILGENVETGVEVMLPLSALSKHIHLVGKTGAGKSRGFLVPIAQQVVKISKGPLVILDPDGSTNEAFLASCPPELLKNIIWAAPGSEDIPYHMGINLLARNRSRVSLEERRFVELLEGLWGPEAGDRSSWGARMEQFSHATNIGGLYAGITTAEIIYFLTDKNIRKRILEKIPETEESHLIRYFFEEEFNKLAPATQKEWASPILNKLYNVLMVHPIRLMVGQSETSLNFDTLIADPKKIILMTLSKEALGSRDAQRFAGAILLSELNRAIFNRKPGESHPLLTVIIDEYQDFVTGDFDYVLTESRKHNACFILAHQYLDQLTLKQQGSADQSGCTITMRVRKKDAVELAPLYAKEGDPIYREEPKQLVILEPGSHILSGLYGYEDQTVIAWLKQNWTEVYKSAREVRGHPGGQEYEKVVGRRKRIVKGRTRLNPYYWIVQDSREELAALNDHLYDLMYAGHEIKQGRVGDTFIPLPVSLLRRVIGNKPELTELYLEGERDNFSMRNYYGNFSFNCVRMLLDLSKERTTCKIPFVNGSDYTYSLTPEEMDALYEPLFIAKTERELQLAHENYALAIQREWKLMLLWIVNEHFKLYSSIHCKCSDFTKGTPAYEAEMRQQFEYWKYHHLRFGLILEVDPSEVDRYFTFDSLQWEYRKSGDRFVSDSLSSSSFIPELYREKNYTYYPPMHSLTLKPGQIEPFYLPYIEKEVDRFAAHYFPLWEALIAELRSIHAAIAAHPITKPSSSGEKEQVEIGRTPQQEMITRMVEELIHLPEYTAYVLSSAFPEKPHIATESLDEVDKGELAFRRAVVIEQSKQYGKDEATVEKEMQDRRAALGIGGVAPANNPVEYTAVPIVKTVKEEKKPLQTAMVFDDNFPLLLFHWHFLDLDSIIRLLGKKPTDRNHIRERLKKLVVAGWIAETDWKEKGKAGKAKKIYSLAEDGLKHVEAEYELKSGSRKMGLTEHTLIVSNTLVQFASLPRFVPEIQLIGFTHERTFKAKAIKLDQGGLEPDGLVRYTLAHPYGNGQLNLYYENDRGFEGKDVWQNKLNKYILALEKGLLGSDRIAISVCHSGGNIVEWTEETLSNHQEYAPHVFLTNVDPLTLTPLEFCTNAIWRKPLTTDLAPLLQTSPDRA